MGITSKRGIIGRSYSQAHHGSIAFQLTIHDIKCKTIRTIFILIWHVTELTTSRISYVESPF